MKYFRALFLLIALFILSACESMMTYPANIRPAAQMGPENVEQRWDYTISLNDVLEIFIWKHTDLSRDVIVRPDGKISMPLIGDIMAEGLTLNKLDAEITKRYSEYLVSPDVSIAVKTFAGEKVFIFGEVTTPGIHTFQKNSSLIEVLAKAGGWNQYAKISNIFVIRGDLTKEPEVILIDIKEILSGNTRLNIMIYPKDIVYVPSTTIADVGRFVRDYLGPLQTTLSTIITVDYLKSK